MPVWSALLAEGTQRPCAGSGTASGESHDGLHGPRPAMMSSGKTISSGVPIASLELDAACSSHVQVISHLRTAENQHLQEKQTAKETDGRYGNKAAYRVRSSRKHRLSNLETPAHASCLDLQTAHLSRDTPAKVRDFRAYHFCLLRRQLFSRFLSYAFCV